jgi:U3 small nucleolar RNA-associated protein 22
VQVDALLPNVRPKISNAAPLERFLFELHSFLKAIPSISPEHPLQASRRLLRKGIATPYCLPLPTEETNWKVAFEPPSDISLVGSWANKLSVKAKDGITFGVDLSVEMPFVRHEFSYWTELRHSPQGLFQEKDYLNGRFFQKKAFYLATIAQAVKCSDTGPNLGVDALYDCTASDTRLTTLVLCPRKGIPASVRLSS